MTITRESVERYSVVTDKVLSDGSMCADRDMQLIWSVRFGCWILKGHITIPLQAETETVRSLPIGASTEV